MDVVVVGPASLQSTMLRLQHRQLPLRFTVYPMIHLAEQSFYDDVCDRLRGHQLIVAEGIHGQGRDRHARLLTLTYRLAGQSSQLGLVVQSQAMLDIGVPFLYHDTATTE